MDQLSKQDQEFVREVAISGNQTQSAKIAYGIESDDYAGKKGSLKVREGKINTAIQEVKRSLAERVNIDELQRVFEEGLNAYTGSGEDVRPDFSVRHKYFDSGAKLVGAYAPEKTMNLDMNVDITDVKARELAEEYENKLKGGL